MTILSRTIPAHHAARIFRAAQRSLRTVVRSVWTVQVRGEPTAKACVLLRSEVDVADELDRIIQEEMR